MERDGSFLVDEILREGAYPCGQGSSRSISLPSASDRARRPAATGSCDDRAKAVPQALLRQRVADAGGPPLTSARGLPVIELLDSGNGYARWDWRRY
jgi:hypothetical protein